MDDEEFEELDRNAEAELYREYRDIVSQFHYVVETERRLYLANSVEVTPVEHTGGVYFRLNLEDVWVWDLYRPNRFVNRVEVITKRDINIEELAVQEIAVPDLLSAEGGLTQDSQSETGRDEH